MHKYTFVLIFSALISTLPTNVSSKEANLKDCDLLNKLPKNASITARRDAIASCMDITEQTSMMRMAQKKLKELEAELAGTSFSKTKTSGEKDEELSARKMIQSESVFLLSSAGRTGNRTAQLFYKGANYWVAEGEEFPGGLLKSVSSDKAIVVLKGKERTIYSTTIEEMKIALGITGSQQQAPTAVPLGYSRRK